MRSDDSTETHTTDDDCPACGATRLRAWGELSEEEREVARRLPAPPERDARRRFCVRCWHEEDEARPRTA